MRIYICFVVLFIFSCADPVVIPENVLSKEKMALILTDVQEAEAQIQSLSLERNDSTKAIAYGYYKSIFEKHKITPEKFRESFDFYANNLGILDKIYDEVIVNLSKAQAEAGNK
jgi:hypothetical protein